MSDIKKINDDFFGPAGDTSIVTFQGKDIEPQLEKVEGILGKEFAQVSGYAGLFVITPQLPDQIVEGLTNEGFQVRNDYRYSVDF